jgi:citrate lyase subunit beta/citryl-CoA lyase
MANNREKALHPPRSYLFVPGDNQKFLAKAEARQADALIIDLEDAISPSNKEIARHRAAEWLRNRIDSAAPVWVRLNRGADQPADLDAVATLPIAGVMLPKLEQSDEIEVALAGLEGSKQAIVIVETAAALRNLDAIAQSEGVYQLMIGEADLGADLGMKEDHPAWDSIRVDIVAASIAAGIHPPIASVNPYFSDADGLLAETVYLRDMGYVSRPAIHPAQVPVIHNAFTPSHEEIAEARTLLKSHESALNDDKGAHGADGRMIDEAFVRRARRVVALAERA